MKQTLNDLAVFRGQAAFEEELHVGRPNIPDKNILLKRFENVLDSRWLTNNGSCVRDFETRIAKFLGVQYCIATCNATTALQILLQAASIHGEVIIPSFTFIATAHALQWHGITPVFCDIDLHTHNIDPDKIEQLITSRTTAILGVHLWGRPCDVESLQAIGKRRNLKVFFDAAQAFACSYHGRMIGNRGNAEILSFHATKILNSFEGGAVVTNDEELARKVQLMRNFGFSDLDSVISLGINGKMSEISAAMGLCSLENLDGFISQNRQNYQQYQLELRQIPGIFLLQYDEAEKSNYHHIVLEIDQNITKLTRNQLVEILQAEKVLTRKYFYPGCHRMEPYRSLFPAAGKRLSNTEMVAGRVLSLPTGTAIQPSQITEICDLLRFVVQNASTIDQRLKNKVDLE